MDLLKNREAEGEMEVALRDLMGRLGNLEGQIGHLLDAMREVNKNSERLGIVESSAASSHKRIDEEIENRRVADSALKGEIYGRVSIILVAVQATIGVMIFLYSSIPK